MYTHRFRQYWKQAPRYLRVAWLLALSACVMSMLTMIATILFAFFEIYRVLNLGHEESERLGRFLAKMCGYAPGVALVSLIILGIVSAYATRTNQRGQRIKGVRTR
jgi:ABC-type Fe3+ transport system permease subunit